MKAQNNNYCIAINRYDSYWNKVLWRNNWKCDFFRFIPFIFNFQNTFCAVQTYCTKNTGYDTAVVGRGAHDQRGSVTTSTPLDVPACRKCRNHGIQVAWKAHKRNCPFMYETIIDIQISFPFEFRLSLPVFLTVHFTIILVFFIEFRIWDFHRGKYWLNMIVGSDSDATGPERTDQR